MELLAEVVATVIAACLALFVVVMLPVVLFAAVLTCGKMLVWVAATII